MLFILVCPSADQLTASATAGDSPGGKFSFLFSSFIKLLWRRKDIWMCSLKGTTLDSLSSRRPLSGIKIQFIQNYIIWFITWHQDFLKFEFFGNLINWSFNCINSFIFYSFFYYTLSFICFLIIYMEMKILFYFLFYSKKLKREIIFGDRLILRSPKEVSNYNSFLFQLFKLRIFFHFCI